MQGYGGAPVRENVVLSLLKVVGVLALTLAVGLSTCQAAKWEDRTERTGKRMSDMKTELASQKSAIQSLERTLRSGKCGTSTGNGGEGPDMGECVPRPGEVDAIAWNKTAPKWLKGRAAKLWGTYGDNYFKPDPNVPKNPALDDPKVNPDASITLWYGTAPKHLNPFTLNDGALNRYVRTYCDEFLGEPHTKNPYLYAPGLAYRTEVSPDYKTWIFWLRPKVRWHRPQVDLEKYPHLAGEHFLTAHDWKFTFDTIMNKDVRAAHTRSYLVDLDRLEVVDDHCFILHWKKSSFSSIGANLNLIRPVPEFVFSKDAAGTTFDPANVGSRINEHWFAQQFNWLGTGPYFVREYNPQSQAVIERNEDSIVLHATFVEGGQESRLFLASDVNYETISEIVQVTRHHGNEDRLLWDIMKLPHHCSYLALAPDRGAEETKPVPDVKWLFEDQREAGAVIVSPSNPIPTKGSEADQGVQPPHRQAANYHRRITNADDGEFRVTMEHPSQTNPKPFAYNVTALGIALDVAAPMVSSSAAASTPKAG